ncbi:DUF3499 domain-containing protein [Acaricomes phytoseiuli]|uniref:DUF3499 domain-containing protein n=1 Tax=Acaricomes phytoseiuli TaxID=291968 RepID=UPI0003731EF0|nr:DUF3499 domain-containing protein [Acaricomes phytoseiuli]
MGKMRQCSRSGCQASAVATLTYVYADSTVVIGPLAIYAEPHTYDFCAKHAENLTAPRGWEIVRLVMPEGGPEPHPDDLLSLADAVREAARSTAERQAQESGPSIAAAPRQSKPPLEPPAEAQNPDRPGRRSYLRVLKDS